MGARQSAVPARGTRPHNRRALIISAASELFHRHGYDKVSMSKIAEAVNVSPSALYRHFSGKHKLLTAAVVQEMTPIRQMLTGFGEANLRTITHGLVRAAMKNDRLGVLWLRESRALPIEEYDHLRHEVSHTVKLLADLLKNRRPGLTEHEARLVALSLCSILCTVSAYPKKLPRAQYQHIIQEAILTIVLVDPAPARHRTQNPLPAGRRPAAQRERLLESAATLFAEYGYAAVSMEDIGAREGFSASTIYRYFVSKEQMLATIMHRGDEWLRYEMHRALQKATTPAEGLFFLLASYIDFVTENNSYVTLLLSESRHLTGQDREQNKQSQRDYISEWVTLIQECESNMQETEARLRVALVLSVVNDLARTKSMRSFPEMLGTTKRFTQRILLPTCRYSVDEPV